MFKGSDFRALLAPPPDAVRSITTGELRLLSVELYTDGLVVRWLLVPTHEGSAIHSPRPLMDSPETNCTVADDSGTVYQPAEVSSAAWDSTHRTEVAFTPKVPATATELRIGVEGQTFVVAVSPRRGE